MKAGAGQGSTTPASMAIAAEGTIRSPDHLYQPWADLKSRIQFLGSWVRKWG